MTAHACRWLARLIAVISVTIAGTLAIGSPAAFQPEECNPDLMTRLEGVEDIEVLCRTGDADEGERRARQRLAEVMGAHGGSSIQTALAMDLLAECLWRAGRGGDPEARAMGGRAVAIKESLLGAGSLGVAASVSNLGWVIRSGGQPAEARPSFERALAIREACLGTAHTIVGWSLENLGSLLTDLGLYDQARPLLERSVAIVEAHYGPDHHELAGSLYNLGNLLKEMGDYSGAEARHRRAREIEMRAHPGGDLHQAWVDMGLALTQESLGEYRDARALLEEALAIAREHLPHQHPFVATCLNNLALLLQRMGDLTGSRELLEKSLDLRMHLYGARHPDVAQSQINLAHVLLGLGDYGEAKGLYINALRTRVAILGPAHPEVASSHFYLASLLAARGEGHDARRHYEKALRIWERSLGAAHVDYASTLEGLAALDARDGAYAMARSHYERALAVAIAAIGPGHPEVARLRNGLADVLLQLGQTAAAREVFQAALGAAEKALGPEHPLTAVSLSGLARTLALQGDPAGAVRYALRAEGISRDHLRSTSRSLSERQALLYSDVQVRGLDVALALAAGDLPGESRRSVLDSLIRARALVLDEMASRSRIAQESRDLEIQRLWEDVISARARLAHLVMREVRGQDPDRHRPLLEEARRDKEKAEKALAARSLPFRERLESSSRGLDEVAAALPARSALVSVAIFQPPELRTENARGGPEGPGRSYLAFVHAQGSAAPQAVLLGTVEEIDDLVDQWKAEVSQPPGSSSSSVARAEAAYRLAGEKLRSKVWDPLLPHLAGVDLVLFVPDGSLNLMNVAALPVSGERYLVEAGPVVHYLSAERDLIAGVPAPGAAGGLLALGGVDFDRANQGPPVAVARRRPGRSGGRRGVSPNTVAREKSACGAFQEEGFPPLPGAAKEASEIVEIWNSTRGRDSTLLSSKAVRTGAGVQPAIWLSGSEATESAFKARAPGNRVLHLATHGFVLGGACRAGAPSSRGIAAASSLNDRDRLPVFEDNPLLQSGLALAGSNQPALGQEGGDDGILTAEEIAGLDLSDVEWAVLSACDTGGGQLRAGEGVFGLRRAFRVAGARTVIMSLWPVGDEDTRRWMRSLYDKRLRDRLDTARAVREASLEILKERRSNGESSHPFHWAAFVGAGDWR